MAKFKIPQRLVPVVYMAILAAFCILVGYIAKWAGAYSPQGWGFFTGLGVLGAMIIFVFGRQGWWFISGTGDYQGRNGLLKRLWNKVFKK